MLKKYIADLKHEFSGYNAGKLLKDILSGITVAAVALPLALAFGVSSGADAAAGLVTAIIGGLVIGLLGGASFQISGPTGAMSAILIGIVAQCGLQGVFVASLAAGVIILLAGIFRLGKLVNFIPTSVVMGFTSGIAIIIALGQVDNFFGTHSVGTSALEKLWSYTSVGFTPNWQAVAIGLMVVLFMVFWPKKLNAKVPGSLLAIILATIVTEIAGFDSLAKVGDIPKSLMLDNRLNLGAVNLDMLQNLVSPIVSIAMLGMIESLLCGASASRMKDEAFDADRELIAHIPVRPCNNQLCRRIPRSDKSFFLPAEQSHCPPNQPQTAAPNRQATKLSKLKARPTCCCEKSRIKAGMTITALTGNNKTALILLLFICLYFQTYS